MWSFFLSKVKKRKALETEYSGISDVDEEIRKRKHQISELEESIVQLRTDYKEKRAVFSALEKQISLLQETLDLAEYGVYEPEFDFDTPNRFKESIQSCRDEQKQLIKYDQAVFCHREWTVEGSVAKGKAMMNRYKRLMLRAFNGECDTFIAKVKWNNVKRMEERIVKAAVSINKLGKTHEMYIVKDYVDLRVKELKLSYEYELRKHEEKEEQLRIREQMREEERVRKELEQAEREAEKDAETFENALKKARAELEQAQGEELERLTSQIDTLQSQLAEALEKKERAISRAQQTKSGHVYVISNVGSFGKDVFKIGMTRRLDPFDRVRELGDASVPFRFDIHAIIYSDNAPELENKLHKAFDNRRVNLVNRRKEFFNTSLDEIEALVAQNHGDIEFTKLTEAREYRETIALQLQDRNTDQEKIQVDVFPDEL